MTYELLDILLALTVVGGAMFLARLMFQRFKRSTATLQIALFMGVAFLVLTGLIAGIGSLIDRFNVTAETVSQPERMQRFLTQVATSQEHASQRLTEALVRVPNAARVRVVVINMRNGGGALTISNPFAAANPGYVAPPWPSNRPIADTYEYLPKMLDGQCALTKVGTLPDDTQQRMVNRDVKMFYVCPIRDNDRLLGMVWFAFENPDSLPKPEQFPVIEAALRKLARDITEDIN